MAGVDTVVIGGARALGSAVGGLFSGYDKEKDRRRQEEAKLLYAAAMNGDRSAAAQLRCFGSLPLLPGDVELLIARSGNTHDAAYFTKCGYASPPAKALARRLAGQLASNGASMPGFNAGNPDTIGTSPMRVTAPGNVQTGAEREATLSYSGVPMVLGLGLLLALVFGIKRKEG